MPSWIIRAIGGFIIGITVGFFGVALVLALYLATVVVDPAILHAGAVVLLFGLCGALLALVAKGQ